MPPMYRRITVRRMLIVLAAVSLFGLCANAELFVVKMTLRVKVVNASTGNLSNVTITAANVIEACGEDPDTSTLVLNSDAPGTDTDPLAVMTIVDNETGDMLVDFATETDTGSTCAINGIGT